MIATSTSASHVTTALAGPAGRGIEVTAVGHSFGEVEALKGLTLTVAPGEIVALVGASGCGKSTLLELIGGLGEPDAGTISVGGEKRTEARLSSCAWMPQRDLLLPWKRADDNAALALRLGGTKRAEARRRARDLLARLGVGEFASKRPAQLSGGMRQRVAFARTLLAGKPVVLLDEPLAALDAITRADLQELLVRTLTELNRTTVLVTHDVEEALFVADRVLLMSPRPGRVIWETTSPVDRNEPRAHAISAPAFVAAREAALEQLERAIGG